jgi:cytochrome c-type biogenesis protein CcmH/NrfG
VGPVTKQSEHLSSAQIENYGIRTSGAGPETAQRDEHQRAEQRMADKLSDDQSAADQSMIDQRSNDQRTSDQDTNDQRIEAHLADCASCRNRLLDFHRSLFASPTYQPEPDRMMAADRTMAEDPKNDHTNSALADSKFANLKDPADPQVRTAATPECPSDDALRQLAAGLTPDDIAAKLTQHAATCNHCGPLLRTYTELFSDDFSPEEQAALANLQSASAEWQKNTARQMLQAGGVQATAAPSPDGQSSPQKSPAKSTIERKPFFWKWVLVPAIAAIVILAAITVPVYLARRDSPEKVERLLAQAYSNPRTIEMRWPGAAHSRLTEFQRGPNDPKIPRPTALLDAENAIGHALEKSPSNSEWLRLHAQSYILEHDPSSAITVLDSAREPNADSPSTILGLAIAHFVQGQDSSDAQEYKQAVKLLNKLLERQPENMVALFNRAIVYEQLHMYQEAAADWSAVLLHEPDEGWKTEAQEHLKRLQEKKTPG